MATGLAAVIAPVTARDASAISEWSAIAHETLIAPIVLTPLPTITVVLASDPSAIFDITRADVPFDAAAIDDHPDGVIMCPTVELPQLQIQDTSKSPELMVAGKRIVADSPWLSLSDTLLIDGYGILFHIQQGRTVQISSICIN